MAKYLNLFDSQEFNRALNFSSPSERIAAKRAAVYDKVMENFSYIKANVTKLGLFSTASMDMQDSQLGVTLKEASLKAYLDSFAGYIAIERPLSQMTELLVYKDMITKGTGAVVLPMIGEQKPRSLAEQQYEVNGTAGESHYTINLESVVPGSLRIVAHIGANNYTITDDRNGNLVAIPGLLTQGTVDYETGDVVLVTATPLAATDKFDVFYAEDQTTDTSNNRIKPKQRHFLINAKVNKFEYEYDLITAAISNKSLGSGDIAADMKQAVYDEHLMAINNSLVHAIKDNYNRTTLTIDLSAFSLAAGQFDSLIKVFNSGLVSVDSALANNCYKIIAATAYVVGTGVSDLFNSMENSNYWVPNNSGFVNGLVGFYKGRAVLRHVDLDEWEAYAIHKTSDGELAPVGLGIFLPATDLPNVGNFLATNEIAGGIYSVEGTSPITTDLVQRFVLNMPADWNIVS